MCQDWDLENNCILLTQSGRILVEFPATLIVLIVLVILLWSEKITVTYWNSLYIWTTYMNIYICIHVLNCTSVWSKTWSEEVGPDGGSDSTGAESDPRSLKCNTVRNICEATSSHARCKNAEIPASWICEIWGILRMWATWKFGNPGVHKIIRDKGLTGAPLPAWWSS